LKKTRRGKFSEISGIFRISEIPKFGNFSEIFRKFRKFWKIPEIIPGKSTSLEVFTNDYSLKPRKNSRIFPPKSPGNPRHFRKISGNFRKFPEILENPGSRPRKIGRFRGRYKRLQPETGGKPPKFAPEIPGKFRKSRKFRKFRKFNIFFVNTAGIYFLYFLEVHGLYYHTVQDLPVGY